MLAGNLEVSMLKEFNVKFLSEITSPETKVSQILVLSPQIVILTLWLESPTVTFLREIIVQPLQKYMPWCWYALLFVHSLSLCLKSRKLPVGVPSKYGFFQNSVLWLNRGGVGVSPD